MGGRADVYLNIIEMTGMKFTETKCLVSNLTLTILIYDMKFSSSDYLYSLGWVVLPVGGVEGDCVTVRQCDHLSPSLSLLGYSNTIDSEGTFRPGNSGHFLGTILHFQII